MEHLSVERSTWMNAPRERVWQAITDPEQIAQWLLPPAMGAQMKRDARGTLLRGSYGGPDCYVGSG
jgi:uncharacterized protein YndB with AHSA1/START domain